MRNGIFKLILCLAAMIFVAKPFVGFSYYNRLAQATIENSLIIKIFAKRKPEFLDEANDRKASIVRLLGSEPTKSISTIQAFVIATCCLFTAMFDLSRSAKSIIKSAAFHAEPAPIYLLNRKLII